MFNSTLTRLRQLGLLSTLGLLSITASAQTTAPAWGSVIRSSTTGSNDYNTTRLTVAPDGTQYLSGVFSGAMTLGGTTYTAQAGRYDLFLAKISPQGTVQWLKQGKTNTASSYPATFSTDAALDAAGNLYFAGSFSERVDFGSGLVLTTSGADVFVLKFDQQGTLQWARTGASNGAGDARLAVDAAGNALVTGSFGGTISFGGTAVSSVGNSTDVFVAKLDASGVAQWVRRAGSSDYDLGADVGVDAAGNTYVVGLCSGAATFGSVTLNPLGSATRYDLFLAKYSPQGTVLWAQRGASTNDDFAQAVAVDADGYAVVSGFSDGTTTGTATQQNVYVARYSPQGTRLWERRVTPSQQTFALGLAGESVAYDGQGGIYVTGFSNGLLTFGSTTVSSRHEGAFVVRYDLQGNPVWADRIDGIFSSNSGSANAHSVGVDAAGNVYLAGEADGDVYFGPVFSSVPSPGSAILLSPYVARLTAGGPLATAAARSAQPLSVFPNPASEAATLQLPAGGGRLVVFDALGRAVREQALPAAAGPCQVELAGLAPGLYRLQATLADGRLATAPLQLR